MDPPYLFTTESHQAGTLSFDIVFRKLMLCDTTIHEPPHRKGHFSPLRRQEKGLLQYNLGQGILWLRSQPNAILTLARIRLMSGTKQAWRKWLWSCSPPHPSGSLMLGLQHGESCTTAHCCQLFTKYHRELLKAAHEIHWCLFETWGRTSSNNPEHREPPDHTPQCFFFQVLSFHKSMFSF